MEEVDAVLRDPELFDRISEDGITDYVTPFDDHQSYLLIVRGGLVIGVWSLYPVNATTLNIHCNILKRYRAHGREAPSVPSRSSMEASSASVSTTGASPPARSRRPSAAMDW